MYVYRTGIFLCFDLIFWFCDIHRIHGFETCAYTQRYTSGVPCHMPCTWCNIHVARSGPVQHMRINSTTMHSLYPPVSPPAPPPPLSPWVVSGIVPKRNACIILCTYLPVCTRAHTLWSFRLLGRTEIPRASTYLMIFPNAARRTRVLTWAWAQRTQRTLTHTGEQRQPYRPYVSSGHSSIILYVHASRESRTYTNCFACVRLCPFDSIHWFSGIRYSTHAHIAWLHTHTHRHTACMHARAVHTKGHAHTHTYTSTHARTYYKLGVLIQNGCVIEKLNFCT